MIKFGKTKSSAKSLIAIVRTDQAKEELLELFEDLEGYQTKIKQTPDVYLNGRALVNGSADVVIVEADAEDPRSEEVLGELCKYVSKGGSMIVISSEPSVQTVRKLFRVGVADVLPLPLNRDDFFKTLKSASEEKLKRPVVTPNGKIIAVAKSNGGVGSTTITLNLARHIMKSKSYQRFDGSQPSVAVFDFNIQFGTAALNLNLKNKANLLTVLHAEERLDEELLFASALKHETGITLLAAPDEIVPVMMPYVDHVHTTSKMFDGFQRLDVDMSKVMIILNQVGKGSIYKQRADQKPYIKWRLIAVFYLKKPVTIEQR